MEYTHTSGKRTCIHSANKPTDTLPIIICPDCDLLIHKHTCPDGYRLHCPRCRTTLAGPQKNSITKTAALSITALLLFTPAHFSPLLSLEVMGIRQSGSLFSTLITLAHQGTYLVALAAFITALLLPLLNQVFLFLITISVIFKKKKQHALTLMRFHHHLQEWGMTEIYLIAVLITIVKMYHSSVIHYHSGFYFYICFVIVNVSLALSFDQSLFWHLLTDTQSVCIQKTKYKSSITANQADFVLCRVCRTPLNILNTDALPKHCPSCSATLHLRTPNSIARTWALILSAIIFAFPANILPIMEIQRFGVSEYSTIMDGIIFFFKTGSYGIGLIIFIASILVPLFKIIGMLIILHTIHFRIDSGLRNKTIMLRFISFIGRWSMLDVFVIALMCSLADFGALSAFHPARGAVYFCAVVMFTMMAANSFDSRLLWDSPKKINGKTNG